MDEPWLSLAKSIPEGTNARMRCCGVDTSRVVYNTTDSWSSYCHRCHIRLYQTKKFVRLQDHQDQSKVKVLPNDTTLISTLDEYTQKELYKFLLSKGMYPSMLPDTLYSPELGRLVFKVTESVYMARALKDSQKPKWLQLNGVARFAIAGTVQNPRLIVLTEDYLSARKVQYVQQEFGDGSVLCIALLGTRLCVQLRAFIVQNVIPVLCMLDGDTAGYTGTNRIQKDLCNFVPVSTFAKQGFDPRDLTCQEILDAITE